MRRALILFPYWLLAGAGVAYIAKIRPDWEMPLAICFLIFSAILGWKALKAIAREPNNSGGRRHARKRRTAHNHIR